MKQLSLIILLSIFGQSLWAQQDTAANYSHNIYTIYTPVLTTPQKIVVRPALMQLSAPQPTFTYNLPNFGYKVLPTYQPAKAIDIRLDAEKTLTGNYFKLGGGNYLTPFAEMQLHSVQDKKFSYGAYGKHLSANAGSPKNANFSDNELGIFGSKITRQGDLTGKLNYERHTIHRYGYNHDSLEFDKKSINQVYNDINGSVFFDNGIIRKKAGYKTGLDFYTFSNGSARENDFKYSLFSEVDLKQNQTIRFNGGIDFTTFDRDSISIKRTFVKIAPSYEFRYKKIDISVGLNAVVTIDSTNAKVIPFPAVSAHHFIVPDKVKVFAAIGGDVKKTSLRQLTYLNPFLADNPELVNTIQSFNINGGISGILKKKFDYLIKVDFSNDNNLPLFLTDTSATHPFKVIYDDVQTTSFQTGLGMRIDEKFFVQFATTLYAYKTKVEDQAWQLPAFDMDVNLRYTIANKLDLRLQLYALGERWQKDSSLLNPVTKLKPILDVNLMADYRYKKNISFFVNVNNMSNVRYQKWYNYPAFGLNVLAGITFSL